MRESRSTSRQRHMEAEAARPLSLTQCMARSALAISTSGVSPSRGYSAMPQDAVTVKLRLSKLNGAANCCSTRRAAASASRTSAFSISSAKLVGPQAREHVVHAKTGAQSFGDVAQHPITP